MGSGRGREGRYGPQDNRRFWQRLVAEGRHSPSGDLSSQRPRGLLQHSTEATLPFCWVSLCLALDESGVKTDRSHLVIPKLSGPTL